MEFRILRNLVEDVGQQGEDAIVPRTPPSLPSCNPGAVEAQVMGVENSVASIFLPDGNMLLGIEPNFIEIFRLQFRFWY